MGIASEVGQHLYRSPSSDLLAPRAVGIDRVAAGLAVSKAGRADHPKAVANVINLYETACPLKPPNASTTWGAALPAIGSDTDPEDPA